MCSFVILACPHFPGTESRLESNGRSGIPRGFSNAAVAAGAALWRLPLPPGHMMSSDARASVRAIGPRPTGGRRRGRRGPLGSMCKGYQNRYVGEGLPHSSNDGGPYENVDKGMGKYSRTYADVTPTWNLKAVFANIFLPLEPDLIFRVVWNRQRICN